MHNEFFVCCCVYDDLHKRLASESEIFKSKAEINVCALSHIGHATEQTVAFLCMCSSCPGHYFILARLPVLCQAFSCTVSAC